MVLLLDVNSETNARSKLCYLICLRHLIRSRAVTNRFLSDENTNSISCVRNIFWTTLQYKQHDVYCEPKQYEGSCIIKGIRSLTTICIYLFIHLSIHFLQPAAHNQYISPIHLLNGRDRQLGKDSSFALYRWMNTMALILDGNSVIGAHVRSNFW